MAGDPPWGGTPPLCPFCAAWLALVLRRRRRRRCPCDCPGTGAWACPASEGGCVDSVVMLTLPGAFPNKWCSVYLSRRCVPGESVTSRRAFPRVETRSIHNQINTLIIDREHRPRLKDRPASITDTDLSNPSRRRTFQQDSRCRTLEFSLDHVFGLPEAGHKGSEIATIPLRLLETLCQLSSPGKPVSAAECASINLSR